MICTHLLLCITFVVNHIAPSQTNRTDCPGEIFCRTIRGGGDGDENNEMHILAFMTPHSAAKAEKQKEICNLPYPYIV